MLVLASRTAAHLDSIHGRSIQAVSDMRGDTECSGVFASVLLA